MTTKQKIKLLYDFFDKGVSGLPVITAKADRTMCDIFSDLMDEVEERPKGKWESGSMNFANNRWLNAIFGQGFHCSECGSYLPNTPTNYCPFCGAEMESEE